MEQDSIKVINNNKIHYVFNNNKSKSLVIMIHGFGMDCHENGNFDKLSNKLLKMGYDTIRIDLIGHGKSEGTSEDLTVTYGIQILNEIIEGIKEKYEEINLIGNSFGGAIVTMYQGININKKVLWSPLLDLYNNIINPSNVFTKEFLGDKGLKLLEKYGYVEFGLSGKKIGIKTFEEAKKIKPYEFLKGNILIVHGDNDLIVPVSQSIEISKKYNTKLIIIKNGNHCFYNDTADEAIKYTLDFLGNKNEVLYK